MIRCADNRETGMEGIQEALRILREGKTFWLASHVRCDGDGLGSLLALSLALRAEGKGVYPVNDGPLPGNLRFLPGYASVSAQRPETLPDGVITLDVPVLERLGVVAEWIPPGTGIINLDHHVSNGRFGRVNIVEPGRSSTGELVYLLLREGKFPLNKEIATCLFTAIYTDTGRFSYSNTAPETMEIAAQLLRLGASVREVSKRTFESLKQGQLQLRARAIERLQVSEDGRIAWSTMRGSDLGEVGCAPGDAYDLIDLPRSLEGVEIALFFQEEGGQVRVSLRSEGEVDVAAVAADFGGGGHRNAAGCKVEGELGETVESLIRRSREALKNG